MRKNQGGFTLIEILMVVMLVAIMAVVAIPQYLDFQSRARDEATKGVLGAIRTGIQNMKAQRIVKCGADAATFPTFATVSNNYLSTANDATCDAADMATLGAGDQLVITGSGEAADIPANPWGGSNVVATCTGCTTAIPRTDCNNDATYSGGWCYDSATGTFYADSNSSPSTITEKDF